MVVHCSACMGSKECWPCLGKGLIPVLHGRARCSSCEGAGRCLRCPTVTVPRQVKREPHVKQPVPAGGS